MLNARLQHDFSSRKDSYVFVNSPSTTLMMATGEANRFANLHLTIEVLKSASV